MQVQEIVAAAARLRGVARRTPLRRSEALSHRAGGDVWLKCENEQITGSFKLRGAFNAVALMPDSERAKGVVASSAGNHGLGVAYAARHFGIPAMIFVPAGAPAVKRDGIAALGATVDASQPDYDAAMTAAKAHAAARGARYINPCLGEDVLAGQGTIAVEILEDLPSVATVVLPVGGGGLLGGIGTFLRASAPTVRIVGAQSVNTAAMSRSLAAGRVVDIPSVPTLADGLAGCIDDAALEIGRWALDEIVTLAESEIAETIAWLAAREGIVAEGSGAAGVAAVLHGQLDSHAAPMAIIVSGGNIDADRHARVVAEHAARV